MDDEIGKNEPKVQADHQSIAIGEINISILPVILILQGDTPSNYVHFLDYAVDRIFLQKVGGGYRFIHRLLLEHFAEMGEGKSVPNIARD